MNPPADFWDFKPAWWLNNGHTQTIWPNLFRKTPRPQTEHERLELDDGDFLDLFHVNRGHSPIVLILHGLEGNIESHYAAGMLKQVQKRGMHGVLLHFRNCGHITNRLPRSYHAGETEDIQRVLKHLKTNGSDTPINVVSYSLSANALLKWLGESGENSMIDKAFAVSPPFDLMQSCEFINKGLSRVYEYHLMKKLRKSAKRKFSEIKGHVDVSTIPSLKNFMEFDDAITSRLHGFENAEHYYSTQSCYQFLEHIKTPTWVIHAENDPFLPKEAIPQADQFSSSTEFLLFPNGGHVGFLESRGFPHVEYWLEKKIPEFIANY
jgi:predicted alpha/beta-fold hydrolase